MAALCPMFLLLWPPQEKEWGVKAAATDTLFPWENPEVMSHDT